jgi:hypothetical protein
MITLQFAAEGGLSTRLIDFYGHGIFSHVDAVIPSTGELLGARFSGGVAVRKPGYARFERTLRVNLDAEPATVDAFWSFMHDQLGKPYDPQAIAAFVFDRDWRRPDSWDCSEMIGSALETCAWFLNPLATPANKLTPPDLLLAISVNQVVDLAKVALG